MGSKRAMLASSLGQVLVDNQPREGMFADLFAGSGAVSWFMAEHCGSKVLAVDLQEYARAVAGSVVCRVRSPIEPARLWDCWVRRAWKWVCAQHDLLEAASFQSMDWETAPLQRVEMARDHCKNGQGRLTRAYGGHYFSPMQALALDGLRETVPESSDYRDLYLAALVFAASECAAAPGHTAQPFQPTATAAPFLFESWRRDVWSYARRAFCDIAGRRAVHKGQARVGEAISFAAKLSELDVAFLDPPYSGVQYSRFYHVLETVATGDTIEPEGVGRYPVFEQRPHSAFSLRSQSELAFELLARALAETGAKCIVTYPAGSCSNGLSGETVTDLLDKYYKVKRVVNASSFSTMGGNGLGRKARMLVDELILVGTPR